ncbi:MAG: glgA 3 [Firmicutes bacterium]|nr:glgA 3 [Bacillota bacterium]
MRSVLFVASEAIPFVKTGGLGEVAGSLPKELNRQGGDVRVILPKYGDIPGEWREKIVHLHDTHTYVGWRMQHCGLQKLEQDGMVYYFVDNEYYFKRPGYYGYYDDAERFAFFCRAVLELLPYLDFSPEIIHCHDWQTAVLPVLLKAHYSHLPEYRRLRTITTIHNLQYQGIFDREVVGDILGLSEDYYFTGERLEFYGAANFLKAGIVFADAITTVSETYAWEITTYEGGKQLDGVLRSRQADVYGILNGIDDTYYDPEHDDYIISPYSWASIERKAENKLRLQERLNLPVDPKIPVVGIASRLVAAKGLDLIAGVLEELMALNMELVILGTGEAYYEDMVRWAMSRYPDKISANIFFDEAFAHQLYAGADIYLMPSLFEPCGISQLIAMRYGAVPIVRATGGLKETVQPFSEETGLGNGFSFTAYNAHDMLYTIEKALSLFNDQSVWRKIVQNGMAADYSWRRSAEKYLDMYGRLLAKDEKEDIALADWSKLAAMTLSPEEMTVQASLSEVQI